MTVEIQGLGPRKDNELFNNSVALMLGDSRAIGAGGVTYWKTLTMVRNARSGIWSPIAGGIKSGEDFRDAVRREAFEEGSLREIDFDFSPNPLSLKTFSDEGGGSHLGIVFRGRHLTRIPDDGMSVSGSETDFIKPFTIDDLLGLVEDPSRIRFPGLNLDLIKYWLRRYIDVNFGYESLKLARYVEEMWGVS